MSAPRVGDRVKVTFEGVVERVPSDGHLCIVGEKGVRRCFDPDSTTVEVLEPAPPAWWPLRDGDVFVDGYGFEFHVIGGRAFCTSPFRRDLDSGMVSPAAVGELLFRDGKPFVDGAE